ncbi:MAG: hypothetical protein ACRDUA_25430 [Micromonosporaceae bacterium]
MGVLVFTAMASDGADRALRLRALELFAIWPMVSAGLICLVSGVVLGLGTKYGLVRYWWVAVKLVLNVVLCALVLVLLRPGVQEVAEQAQRYSAGEVASLVAGDMVFPPIVSTLALLVAVVLSVFKPWGRIRKQKHVSRSNWRTTPDTGSATGGESRSTGTGRPPAAIGAERSATPALDTAG